MQEALLNAHILVQSSHAEVRRCKCTKTKNGYLDMTVVSKYLCANVIRFHFDLFTFAERFKITSATYGSSVQQKKKEIKIIN